MNVEFGEITAELKEFRAVFPKVEIQLTSFESKIDQMDGLVSKVQNYSRYLKAGINTIDCRFSSAKTTPLNQLMKR